MELNEKEFRAVVDFFNGDELAASVWSKKYRLPNEKHPTEMVNRCCSEIYPLLKERLDKIRTSKVLADSNFSWIKNRLKNFNEDTLRYYLSKFIIIPGGSMLSGLGNPKPISLSNCFVISRPEDSYPSIMLTELKMTELMKRRGGVGTDMSHIRPNGAVVNNSAETSTGVVPFYDQYSDCTNRVAQGGRRGALMLTISIKHPDVLDVIKVKRDKTRITGANLSIMTDDPVFMDLVRRYKREGIDSDYILRFPVEKVITNGEVNQNWEYEKLIQLDNGVYVKRTKISTLWDNFVRSNWECADPGLIFKDTQDDYSTSNIYDDYKNLSTNPCGEIMMGGEDSCRLIAAGVHHYVNNPFTPECSFDEKGWGLACFLQAVIGDVLVDIEASRVDLIIKKVESDKGLSKLERSVVLDLWNKIKKTGLNGRRIGAGFTGLGDAFAEMGLDYGDPKFLNEVMRIKFINEWIASVALSEVYGSFEGHNNYNESRIKFFGRLYDEDWGGFNDAKNALFELMRKYGRRNISISTCAPNGTTSIIAQCTSGIEPVFMFEYMRSVKQDENATDFDYQDEVGCKFKNYPVRHFGYQKYLMTEGKFEKNPYESNQAQDLNYKKRVMNQSIIQRYVSHSISSTVNLPADVSEETMSEIYIYAWEMGLKGITVYRDGSKGGILKAADKKKDSEDDDSVRKIKKFVRPESLPCKIIKVMGRNEETGENEPWLAFLGICDGRPVEIFTGKAAGAFKLPEGSSDYKIVKVKIDKYTNRYDFRYVDPDGYSCTIESLSKCFNPAFYNYSKLVSQLLKNGLEIDHVINILKDLRLDDGINAWKTAVIRALAKYVKNGTITREKCPECGKDLIYVEGCCKCSDPGCGYSRCN